MKKIIFRTLLTGLFVSTLFSTGCKQRVQDMHDAAMEGNLARVKYFVENGDVNAKDDHGYTLIYNAAFGGRLAVVKYLVEKGADVNAKNDDGKTPIFAAVVRDKFEVVKYLVEKGADVNAKDDDDKTPLDYTRFVDDKIKKILNEASENSENIADTTKSK
jgi:ankyrin repeat protein